MPNNTDKLHDKLYEEYEDSLFRLIMHEAAKREGRLLLEEGEGLKNDPAFSPSQEAIGQFRRQFRARLKKDKAAFRKQAWHKALNRAAAAVLAVAVVFSAAMSVQALRIRVLNLLISVEDKYTSFQFDSGDASDSGVPEVNWENEYMPAYIPDGFEVSSVSSTDAIKVVVYENAGGQYVTYSIYAAGSTVAVDSENASKIEQIQINGNDGTLIVKEALTSVVWKMGDRLLVVQGDISEDEAVKMARGVQLIK